MEQSELRKVIEDILEKSEIGTMATIRNNKPYSRYMTFFHKDLKLYTATSKETDKAEELKDNPYTHVLLGYEGDGFGDDYVEYEGKVAITHSEELKKELWNPHMEPYFNGPKDSNFIVLEIEPQRILLMNKQGVSPKVFEL